LMATTSPISTARASTTPSSGARTSVSLTRVASDCTAAAWRAAGLTGVGVQLMSLGGGLIMWGSKS